MALSDESYMIQALDWARKGLGLTSPNPLVGALVVRDGEVVGAGFHPRAGAEHAEVLALQGAAEAARGATLYVTLEPCCHTGRTPPCTRAVIASGVARVVAGMEDPNPLVAGRGIDELRRAGIEVTVGVLEEECRRLNEVFIKYITSGLPFVTVKVASTLDGKIATRTGESHWITGPEARQCAHRLRATADAILVGATTVRADDPQLTVRLPEKNWPRQPLRVIVDSRLSLPLHYAVFTDGGNTLVAGTDGAPAERRQELEARGVSLLILPARGGRVDLAALARELGRRTVTHLLIEGGGEVIGEALSAGIVDKAVFFIAPKILGGRGAVGAVGGREADRLAESYSLSEVAVERVGEDIMVSGYIGSPAVRGAA